jgi:hypothetical protein
MTVTVVSDWSAKFLELVYSKNHIPIYTYGYIYIYKQSAHK